MSKQKRKVEWSFDFEDMGERLRQFFSDMAGEEVEVKSANFLPRARARLRLASKLTFPSAAPA